MECPNCKYMFKSVKRHLPPLKSKFSLYNTLCGRNSGAYMPLMANDREPVTCQLCKKYARAQKEKSFWIEKDGSISCGLSLPSGANEIVFRRTNELNS